MIVEYLDNRFQGCLIYRTSGFRRLLAVIYRLLDGSLAVCVRLVNCIVEHMSDTEQETQLGSQSQSGQGL